MKNNTLGKRFFRVLTGIICTAAVCTSVLGGAASAYAASAVNETQLVTQTAAYGAVNSTTGTTVTYSTANGTVQSKYIPVLMYHHFTTDPNPASTATITAAKFRLDMAYLAFAGYTPLLPQDLKAIQEGTMIMPEKPIMITIDDGYESAYTIAYPILKETGMKATVYVIVNGVENPTATEIKKLSWTQMKEMYESGYFDIQSHSYNLHNPHLSGQFNEFQVNGIQAEPNETRAKYINRVAPDIWKSIQLIEKNVGTDVISFSYPYGAYDPWGQEILQGYGVIYAVGTVYGLADLEQSWFNMNRFSVGMGTMLWDLIKIPGVDTPAVN